MLAANDLIDLIKINPARFARNPTRMATGLNVLVPQQDRPYKTPSAGDGTVLGARKPRCRRKGAKVLPMCSLDLRSRFKILCNNLIFNHNSSILSNGSIPLRERAARNCSVP